MRGRYLALLALCASAVVHAAARPFAWTYDTEVVADGAFESEQWLWTENGSPASPEATTYYVWWAPVFGVSDHLELAFPFELSDTRGEPITFEHIQADVRYRFLSRLDKSPFQGLFRLAYRQQVGPKPYANDPEDDSRLDANLIGSFDPSSSFHFTLDLGSRLGFPSIGGLKAPPVLQGSYDLGGAYRFGDGELQAGFELLGLVPLINVQSGFQPQVGPDFSWTRGRMWLTLGALIGLNAYAPRLMTRLIWSVSL